jgi:hypothetical protein
MGLLRQLHPPWYDDVMLDLPAVVVGGGGIVPRHFLLLIFYFAPS